MRKGFSLPELVACLVILGVLMAASIPRLAGILDWLATDAAARDLTTALAAARATAVMQGTRARLLIGADSLQIDRWGGADWARYKRWPGPRARGVMLEVSNVEVVFGPSGMGWGASNTKVVLRRGFKTATITTSRVGRVKRW
jgi:prepilin-type N-terminal cleavage/methylation domain-containing protein